MKPRAQSLHSYMAKIATVVQNDIQLWQLNGLMLGMPKLWRALAIPTDKRGIM